MSTPDWEFFLTDPDPATQPPPVPWRLRRYAMARTARALWTYRKHGWPRAYPYLQRLCPGPGAAALTAVDHGTAIRLARREIFFAQLVARVLLPNGLCLPRSFALATYLNAIGSPAQVIVARGKTAALPTHEFHAWTQLHGSVLNDFADVLLGYTVLQRVPTRGQPQPTADTAGAPGESR
ncbi:lasso peptide biosynthesis protein [Amycolatopsis sp. lyj-346]|uniref:lasso peptide biosynthesis protein n=1 Tax=Amycolatopsis sp. lyj-346 TaxID=2789289 RepID=UPI00397E68A9